VRLMGRCVLWAGVSFGSVCLIGRCGLWGGASYGPGNTVYSIAMLLNLFLLTERLKWLQNLLRNPCLSTVNQI